MELMEDVSRVKDLHEREFKVFTRNFYTMRSALRYFSVKQGLSFTSSKVAENFPANISVAGACLKVMEELDVIESRTSSKKRYMPGETDLERMEKIGALLRENYEIRDFDP